MKPRPFEVGDRVIVKQNAYQGWGAGLTGEIVRVDPEDSLVPTRFYIYFDNGEGERLLG